MLVLEGAQYVTCTKPPLGGAKVKHVLIVHSGFKVLTSSRFQYLEVQLIHMPGLRQRSPKLENVSHTIPGKKCWARKELLNL